MRALLISANTEQLQMPVLPMGLACVAAAAEHAGHEVRFLNLMTKDDFQELKLENAVSGFNPELIGVSVRNIDDQCMKSPRFLLDAVKNVVTSCRRLTPVPIVLGGAGYSIYPRSALAYLGADMGIKGEGEAAFVKLLDALSRKEGLAGVPNLVLAESSRENKTEVLTKARRLRVARSQRPVFVSHGIQKSKNLASLPNPEGLPDGMQFLFDRNHRGADFAEKVP